MKKHLSLKWIPALAIAGMLSYSSFGQLLPPNFQSQKQLEYNNTPDIEVDFPTFLQNETLEYNRKQAIVSNPGLAYRPVVPGQATINVTCTNGNFESGIDTNFWKGGYGAVNGLGTVMYNNFTAGFLSGSYNSGAARQTLMTAGSDSTLLASVPSVIMSRVAPSGSTQSVRIGNRATGNGAELISKTFVVSAANSNVSFWYALVLQSPTVASHTGVNIPKQPSFRVRIVDSVGTEIPGLVNLGGGSDEAMADTANPFFQNTTFGGQALVYRNWSCAQLNLSTLIGRTITVQFVTKDCALGQHFGYAYIDNFCGDCNVPGNTGGTITPGTSSGCDVGTICVNFTVPQAPNGSTGTVQPKLRIYQNGALVNTLTGGTFSANGSYCFNVNPASLGLSAGATGFDYTIEGIFNLGGVSLAPITVGNAAIGQGNGTNDDYKVACTSQRQCCPGQNLIQNGNFEAGNTGFSSAYTYAAPGGLNSVPTGNYSVLTSTQALAVSPTWIAGCADYGKALIVNAATENPASTSKIAWAQNVSLRANNYKFCGDFRNLAQCAFNVSPKIRIVATSNTTGAVIAESSTILSLASSACAWTNLDLDLTVTADMSVSFRVFVSESMSGDGNDIAMDNFSLVKLDSVAISAAMFNVVFSNVTSSSYNATATPTAALTKGCSHFWQVEEVTPPSYTVVPGTQVVNASIWTSPNTFKGYVGSSILFGTNPGVFNPAKTYRFIYGRQCDCATLRTYAHIYGPSTAGMPAGGRTAPVLISSKEYNAAAESNFRVDEHADGSVIENPLNPQTDIKVFPNPTKENVTISMAPLSYNAILKVLSSTGQEVKSINIAAGETEILVPLNGLSSGMYLLHMTSADGLIILNQKVSKL